MYRIQTSGSSQLSHQFNTIKSYSKYLAINMGRLTRAALPAPEVEYPRRNLHDTAAPRGGLSSTLWLRTRL